MYAKFIVAFIASSPTVFGAAVNFTRLAPIISQPDVANITTAEAASVNSEVFEGSRIPIPPPEDSSEPMNLTSAWRTPVAKGRNNLPRVGDTGVPCDARYSYMLPEGFYCDPVPGSKASYPHSITWDDTIKEGRLCDYEYGEKYPPTWICKCNAIGDHGLCKYKRGNWPKDWDYVSPPCPVYPKDSDCQYDVRCFTNPGKGCEMVPP